MQFINNYTHNLIIIAFAINEKQEMLKKKHKMGWWNLICTSWGYFLKKVSLKVGLNEQEAHPGCIASEMHPGTETKVFYSMSGLSLCYKLSSLLLSGYLLNIDNEIVGWRLSVLFISFARSCLTVCSSFNNSVDNIYINPISWIKKHLLPHFQVSR